MTAETGVEPQRILDVTHLAPSFEVPLGACDCHVHVFGAPDQYPFAPDRLYTPGPASVDDLLTLQGRLGLDRAVVVQPSPYGVDNRCTLDALKKLGSRARGVAVIDRQTSDFDLHAMHQTGVRGARVNLETLQQNDVSFAREILVDTAARVAPLGWHVQTYTNLAVISALHDDIARLPVPLVIDHFGRAMAAEGTGQRGFAILLDLLESGRCYVKVSAAHRISSLEDVSDAAAIARAYLDANPSRVVWGSDWPHPGAWPGLKRHREIIEPFHSIDDGVALSRLRQWCGDAATFRQVLVENPARLYGF